MAGEPAVEEVSAGSQEQARDIQQIAQTIAGMEQLTPTTAAGAQESAASAQELNAQSSVLNRIVEQLCSLIGHGRATGISSTRPIAPVDGVALDDRIRSARGSHGLWKTRIREAIQSGSSEVSVDVALNDHQCALGQWLHGSGIDSNTARSQAYINCVELHRRFHLAAAEALTHALAGKKQEARQAIEPGGRFAIASTELLGALMEFKL